MIIVQSGANCLWYTNYTHIVGEPTLAPEMRTFPNIEPYLEVFFICYPAPKIAMSVCP